MDGSEDCFDFSPELTISEERNAIPIDCWQNILLPDIWIPSILLPSRKEPSNNRIIKGIFHTLEKRDSSKNIPGFSVYSDSEEEEIFSSDSEDLFNLDIGSCKKIEKRAKTFSENALAEIATLSSGDTCRNYNEKDTEIGISKLKQIPSVNNLCSIGVETTLNQEQTRTDSHISLNEILDKTPEFNLNDFRHKDTKFQGFQEKLEPNEKKNKRKKKKASKFITLDEFRGDYAEGDYQNDCCNDYFRKLLNEKHKTDEMQLRSTAHFPDLAPKEFKFIPSEHTEPKNDSPSIKMVTEILSKSNEVNRNDNISTDCIEEAAPAVMETEINHGQFVIENIPNEANKDDIHTLLCGYGMILSFSLVSVGNFLKAYVKIDSPSDIDWIIECLNESEAFGTSTKLLKCYKQE